MTTNKYGDLIFNEMLENDVYKMRLSIGRGGGEKVKPFVTLSTRGTECIK